MSLRRFRYHIAFAIAAALLLLVGTGLLLATRQARSDNRWVEHTLAVIGRIESLHADLLQAIGAQRSYVLTGDVAYRQLNEAARVEALDDKRALLQLVDDNPGQEARARALGRLIDQRLAISAKGAELYDRQGFATAREYARANGSRDLSRRIDLQVEAIRNIELDLLERRRGAAERSADQLLALGLLGIPLSLLILGLMFRMLGAEVRDRVLAERKSRTLYGELAQSVAALERVGTELRGLSEYAGLLQGCRDMAEALQVTRRALEGLLPHCAGAVYLLRASQDHAELEASWGTAPATSVALLPPQDCWCLRRGQPHHVPSLATGVACAHILPGDEDAATACIPLVAQGVSLGFLFLACARPADGTGIPGLSLAGTAAEQLSLAIGNLRLQHTLRQQSIRDALTGLYNRRYLEESAAREIARCERRNQPLALMMLDLDHFKTFNDTHGHDAGDALLAAFGQALAAACRPEDIPCRYGGEEFTVIMAETGLEAALQRAEQVRQRVEQLVVNHLKREIRGVTVSIGVAVFPDHGETASALHRAADAALYRAKRNGRNRTEIARDTADA